MTKIETPRRDAQNMAAVEFISYDGKYPSLCNGTLVVAIDGERFELRNVIGSTGTCGADTDYEPTRGEWKFDEEPSKLPEKVLAYQDVILQLVNENVEHGCCGGCD